MSIKYKNWMGDVITLEGCCYIDGFHGRYVHERLADLFVGLEGGNMGAGEYRKMIVDAYRTDDLDLIIELSDEILSLMGLRTEGGQWAWVDGELFLEEVDDDYGHLFGSSDHCSRCFAERGEGDYYDGCN